MEGAWLWTLGCTGGAVGLLQGFNWSVDTLSVLSLICRVKWSRHRCRTVWGRRRAAGGMGHVSPTRRTLLVRGQGCLAASMAVVLCLLEARTAAFSVRETDQEMDLKEVQDNQKIDWENEW
jgi:hypothetical protein